MKSQIQLKNLISNSSRSLIYTEDDVCPICKSKISPVYLSSSLNTESTASVFNYCRGCKSTFVTTYSLKQSNKFSINGIYEVESLLCTEPNRFVKHQFEEPICSLSPQFDKIYNQALAAESYGLDEVAGIGYRKSLEFLIKDYLIHSKPDEIESIKSLPLGKCIKDKIDNEQLQLAASRAVWLGNDQTHYQQKFEDKDIADLKRLIRLTVHWISMLLETEELINMQPR